MRQNNAKIFKIFSYENNDNRKKLHGEIRKRVKSENAFYYPFPKLLSFPSAFQNKQEQLLYACLALKNQHFK
jgi:hypothetical protein